MFQLSSWKDEFLRFRCWYSMKVRYVVFRAPKYFIGRCLVKFRNSRFVLIGIHIHSTFQIPLWKIVFNCCSYSLLKRSTLNLLGANNLIWQFLFHFRSVSEFLEQSFRVYKGSWNIQASSWKSIFCVFFRLKFKEDLVCGTKGT